MQAIQQFRRFISRHFDDSSYRPCSRAASMHLEPWISNAYNLVVPLLRERTGSYCNLSLGYPWSLWLGFTKLSILH